MSLECKHADRIYDLVEIDQDTYEAVIQCEDCNQELSCETAWALERAEKAEARVKELEKAINKAFVYGDATSTHLNMVKMRRDNII